MADSCSRIRVLIARRPLTRDTTSRRPCRFVIKPRASCAFAKFVQKWAVYIDPYTKLTRLDLYKFDGSPMNPMFQAYNPPQMLPTITMNPTTSAAPAATAKAKRGLEYDLPLNKDAAHIKRDIARPSLLQRIDLSMLWWAGVGMTIFGGAAYLL